MSDFDYAVKHERSCELIQLCTLSPLYFQVLKICFSTVASLRVVTTHHRQTLWITLISVQVHSVNHISHGYINYLIIVILYFVGLENRPKDVGKFYFWMTVRGKDLDFLVASLSEEESAHEIEESQVKGATESTYAKRKRRLEDSISQQKLSDQSQQMAMFKEIMSTPDRSATPQSSDSIDSVNNSVVQKNLASANEKRVNNLLKVMDNATVFGLYTMDEQNKMKNDLKLLISSG